jgi:hypothetical protein
MFTPAKANFCRHPLSVCWGRLAEAAGERPIWQTGRYQTEALLFVGFYPRAGLY